jgi:hypothetical protein
MIAPCIFGDCRVSALRISEARRAQTPRVLQVACTLYTGRASSPEHDDVLRRGFVLHMPVHETQEFQEIPDTPVGRAQHVLRRRLCSPAQSTARNQGKINKVQVQGLHQVRVLLPYPHLSHARI